MDSLSHLAEKSSWITVYCDSPTHQTQPTAARASAGERTQFLTAEHEPYDFKTHFADRSVNSRSFPSHRASVDYIEVSAGYRALQASWALRQHLIDSDSNQVYGSDAHRQPESLYHLDTLQPSLPVYPNALPFADDFPVTQVSQLGQNRSSSTSTSAASWAAIPKYQYGMSTNYQGSRWNPANYSAPIHIGENCSLWITGLPNDITYSELLASITDCGRIFSSYINYPDFHAGQYFAAAKVVFFTRSGAHNLMRAGLTIRGRPAVITPNRIRVAESQLPSDHTRVLRITGPAGLVNVPALAQILHDHQVMYGLDRIIERDTTGVWNPDIEWRFASYRCQARLAKDIISRLLGNRVRVEYAPDPCGG